MNSFELIPTEENLIHTLDKDLLKRNKDLVRFYDLILAQEGDSSIAIDGRWGSGKTFFVKQSMLLINAKNPMSDMDDEKKASIDVYKRQRQEYIRSGICQHIYLSVNMT